MLHDTQIMSDKQIGQSQLFLKILKHIDHLCLYRNIKRRNRLVTDNKLRVYRKRTGNTHTLPLSSGKLMGIPVGVLAVKPHTLQKRKNTVAPFLFTVRKLMDINRLSDNISNRHTGIQTCIWILKNNLHPAPVWQHIYSTLGTKDHIAVSVPLRCSIRILQRMLSAVKYNLSIIYNTSVRRLIQPEHGTADCCFSAARLSYKSQRLASSDCKRHVIDRFYDPLVLSVASCRKVLLQMLYFHQNVLFIHSPLPPSSNWSF